jgi:hypothetical protein
MLSPVVLQHACLVSQPGQHEVGEQRLMRLRRAATGLLRPCCLRTSTVHCTGGRQAAEQGELWRAVEAVEYAASRVAALQEQQEWKTPTSAAVSFLVQGLRPHQQASSYATTIKQA